MSNYRLPVGYAGEPIQQGMVRRPDDNSHLLAGNLELGIIISVYPADSTDNRTAQESVVRRGWRHECTVQIVSSGHNGVYRLTNVVIPPSSPSGVDSYEEQLPRGCTATFKEGGTFDPSMQMSSPYDLDGDWCVVGFLKRDRDQPFILSWWPNPNNPYDPQTGGTGNPTSGGQGTALNQAGRYFRRTNGIEYTVTKNGDVYFDTTFAGEKVSVTEPEKQGRLTRIKSEAGGNIRTVLKTSASVEIDFNTPLDGIGVLDSADPGIPQSNPAANRSSSTQRSNSYLRFNKDVLHLKCPDTIKFTANTVEVIGGERANIVAPTVSIGKEQADIWVTGGGITEEASDIIELVAPQINLTTEETVQINTGNELNIEASFINVTRFPQITMNATEFSLEAPVSVTITSPAVTISSGSGPSLPLLNNTIAETSSTAIGSIIPPVATLSGLNASLASVIAYLQTLNTAMQSGQTTSLLSG